MTRKITEAQIKITNEPEDWSFRVVGENKVKSIKESSNKEQALVINYEDGSIEVFRYLPYILLLKKVEENNDK